MTYFNLRVKPAKKLKVVISVPKKVSKKAVIRNTIKRRLRPILKNFLLKPAEYLFVAKPGAEKVKGEDLKNELSGLIRSIRS